VPEPDAPSQRVAVLDAPSNLGLRPPAPGREPGARRMAATLRARGLLDLVDVMDAGAVDAPAYSPEPHADSGFRNGAGITAHTRALADRVGELLDQRRFPVVLGGDCSIVLGPTLALRRRGRSGLVFIDAHDDYSPIRDAQRYAGSFAAAGLDLGLATGHLAPTLADIDGLGPYVREDDAVHIGLVREPEDDEFARTELFARSGVAVFPAFEIKARGPAAVLGDITALLRRPDLDGFWVHVDADVLAESVMPAVDSPNPSGLTADQLTSILAGLVAENGCRGVEFTIYDPDLDPDGVAADVLIGIIAATVNAVPDPNGGEPQLDPKQGPSPEHANQPSPTPPKPDRT